MLIWTFLSFAWVFSFPALLNIVLFGKEKRMIRRKMADCEKFISFVEEAASKRAAREDRLALFEGLPLRERDFLVSVARDCEGDEAFCASMKEAVCLLRDIQAQRRQLLGELSLFRRGESGVSDLVAPNFLDKTVFR